MKQIKIFSGVSGIPITDPEEAANEWIQENSDLLIDDIRVASTECYGTLYVFVSVMYEIPDDTYKIRPGLEECLQREHEQLMNDVSEMQKAGKLA